MPLICVWKCTPVVGGALLVHHFLQLQVPEPGWWIAMTPVSGLLRENRMSPNAMRLYIYCTSKVLTHMLCADHIMCLCRCGFLLCLGAPPTLPGFFHAVFKLVHSLCQLIIHIFWCWLLVEFGRPFGTSLYCSVCSCPFCWYGKYRQRVDV